MFLQHLIGQLGISMAGTLLHVLKNEKLSANAVGMHWKHMPESHDHEVTSQPTTSLHNELDQLESDKIHVGSMPPILHKKLWLFTLVYFSIRDTYQRIWPWKSLVFSRSHFYNWLWPVPVQSYCNWGMGYASEGGRLHLAGGGVLERTGNVLQLTFCYFFIYR
jgi:hypothetical protein